VQSGETSGLCGEEPGDTIYHKCAYALAMFQRLKYTSMSHYELFDVNAPCNTIPIWDAGGCEPEIKVKLGYRFQLVNATIPSAVNLGTTLQMRFQMANTGWATAVNPRGVQVVLRNKLTNQEFFIQLADGLSTPTDRTLDPRFWTNESLTTININKALPANIPVGDYDLFLHLFAPEASIKSRPEYAIRLANQNVWEPSTGYNSLQTSLKVNSFVLSLTTDTSRSRNANTEVIPMNIYPNPVNQNLIVNYSLQQGHIIQIDVTNSLGVKVMRLSPMRQGKGVHLQKINTAHLPNGIYFVTMRIDERMLTMKFVVNH
jgi:hypothetical protein